MDDIELHSGRPWASAEIFPGGGATLTFCLYFQVADDAMQTDFHKTLCVF